MELKEIFENIQTKVVVPLWPHVGMALGMSRGSIYAVAHCNEIDVTHVSETRLFVIQMYYDSLASRGSSGMYSVEKILSALGRRLWQTIIGR